MGILILYLIIFKVIEIAISYRLFADGDVTTKKEFWLTTGMIVVPFSLAIMIMMFGLSKISNFYKSLPNDKD